MDIKRELEEYIGAIAPNDTHSHHWGDSGYEDMTLHKLVSMCYCMWIAPAFPDTDAGWDGFFELMETNSYLYLLSDAIGRLYGERLTRESRKELDRRIRAAYAADPEWHLKVLTDVCRYRNVIVDDYTSPGSDHGVSFVRPTLRTDMFIAGYAEGKTNENKNDPYARFERMPRSFAEYVVQLDYAVKTAKAKGCCALKLAIAYERGINFEDFDISKAERAFGNPNASAQDVRAFGDCAADALCEIAAKYDMPYQIHTGLGGMTDTRAMNLLPLIRRHPNTKFVLFHFSYPWSDDVLGLAHYFRNVYPDLCWVPIISPARAEAVLSEALDTLDSHRLTWGCDTWTSEESLAALIAVRQVLANVLTEKVERGYYSLDLAKKTALGILHDNASRLYHL